MKISDAIILLSTIITPCAPRFFETFKPRNLLTSVKLPDGSFVLVKVPIVSYLAETGYKVGDSYPNSPSDVVFDENCQPSCPCFAGKRDYSTDCFYMATCLPNQFSENIDENGCRTTFPVTYKCTDLCLGGGDIFQVVTETSATIHVYSDNPLCPEASKTESFRCFCMGGSDITEAQCQSCQAVAT